MNAFGVGGDWLHDKKDSEFDSDIKKIRSH